LNDTVMTENLSQLNHAVNDLKLAVTELRITFAGMTIRDVEDRGASTKLDGRISVVELWKSRIQGQIALLGIAVGALAAVVAARIAGLF